MLPIWAEKELEDIRAWRGLSFKWPIVCQRCGGQVMDFSGGRQCLQCGAEHDEDGNWVEPVIVFGEVEKTGIPHHYEKGLR